MCFGTISFYHNEILSTHARLVESSVSDDFDVDTVNVPFLDGNVRGRASYCIYISQLIWFARVCNLVADLIARNKC